MIVVVRSLQSLARPAIIAFCVWHMAAVAIYAVPDPAHDAVTEWIRAHLTPVIRPYMFATSQWQQWNLFSPNPQQRVSQFFITEEPANASFDLETAKPRLILEPNTYRWWRKTDEIAIFSKWEDQSADVTTPLLERYLLAYCTALNIPSTSTLHLGGRYAFLPIQTRAELSQQPPKLYWQTFHSVSVPCADADGVSPIFAPDS